MNKVTLIGRLVSKPELRYTSSNIPVTRFSIAINRYSKGSKEDNKTDFINVVVWNKQAENVCDYLDKGRLIGVDGRLQSNRYTDKDGNNRYSMEVVANNVQFLERKR